MGDRTRLYFTLAWGIGLASGLAAVVGLKLGHADALSLTVVSVLMVTVGYGLWWASLAALLAYAAALEIGLPMPYAPYLLSSLVAALAGGMMVRGILMAGYHRQRIAREEAALIIEALETLTQLPSRRTVLSAVPPLLARRRVGHVSVLLPHPSGKGLGFLVAHGINLKDMPSILPWTSVTGRVFQSKESFYLAQAESDPGFVTTPEIRGQSELALPLFERGEVVAVLNLEQPQALSPYQRTAYTRFSHAISHVLSTLAEREEARLLGELAAELAAAPNLEDAARGAVERLVKALGLRSGWLYRFRRGRFTALGLYGELPKELAQLVHEGLPAKAGLVWEVYLEGRTAFVEDYSNLPEGMSMVRAGGTHSLALQPASPLPRPRAILALEDARPRRWNNAERKLVERSAALFSLMFNRFQQAEYSQQLLALEYELGVLSEEALYTKLMEAAVELVPGAEAGSLMIREAEGWFRYRATLGFPLETFSPARLDEAEERRWYGGEKADWQTGKPRILRGDEVARRSNLSGELKKHGLVQAIRADLCLPVPYQGEVLALLNLDSLSDEEAFAEDSLQAAQAFSTQLAAIIHEVRNRTLLKEYARTDALTGLPNRRAFNHRFAEETSRALRHAQPLSLLVMDLRQFKLANDILGHARGDEVLIRVGQALSKVARQGDLVFRWGGDEFAALLPYTTKAEAAVPAGRFVKAVAEIGTAEIGLGVNIGIASIPEDASSADVLMSLADKRMYQAKAVGIPICS